MAERDLECFLCQRHFTAMYGDFIIPWELICDDCLAELEPLEESELRQRIAERLAQRDIADPEIEARVVQAIRRPRLSSADLTEIIREAQRRAR